MKAVLIGIVSLAALQVSASASANGFGYDRACSIGKLAGRWTFATDLGHETLAFGGDITAIGIFAVDRNGNVEGVFDVTFENNVFSPDVPFEGTISVDEDCTGTLSFVTGTGASRTDSIVMLNRYELWGMSQDPQNLWTFRARRLTGR